MQAVILTLLEGIGNGTIYLRFFCDSASGKEMSGKHTQHLYQKCAISPRGLLQ